MTTRHTDPLLQPQLPHTPPRTGWKALRLRADGTIASEYGDTTWTLRQWQVVSVTRRPLVLCSYGFHDAPDPLEALNRIRGEVIARTETTGATEQAEDGLKAVHHAMRLTEAWRWTSGDSVALAEEAARRAQELLLAFDTAAQAKFGQVSERVWLPHFLGSMHQQVHEALSWARLAYEAHTQGDAYSATARATYAARNAAKAQVYTWEVSPPTPPLPTIDYAVAYRAACQPLITWLVQHIETQCERVV